MAFFGVAVSLFFLLGEEKPEAIEGAGLLDYFSAYPGILQSATYVLYHLAIGISLFYYSRVAAFLLFAESAVSLISTISREISLEDDSQVFVTFFIFLLSFIGALEYHRFQKQQNISTLHAKRVVSIFLPLAIIAMFCSNFHSILVLTDVSPPSYILTKKDIADRTIVTLQDNNIIHEDEVVRFFSSNGFFTILEEGNVLTDKRVISYETIDEKLNIYQAEFEDIEYIEALQTGYLYAYTIIKVQPKNRDAFLLFLLPHGQGDVDFVVALWEEIGKEKFLHNMNKSRFY